MFDRIIEDCDILSPQIREMYQSLMQAGDIDGAQALARTRNAERQLEATEDYLSYKRRMVYNMWVHQIAKALEAKTCSRNSLPCNLCLLQARDIGGELWKLMCRFLEVLKPNHWGTPWDLLNMLQKVLEVQPIVTPPPQETTLQIVKSPILEAKYAARNDSD